MGGFASSTIVGLNTRRYHGLLTAATKPPVGRVVLLSKLEETLVVDGKRYDLSANQYPGVVHPEGHNALREFRLDRRFQFSSYQVDGLEIEKRVFMVYGENTTVVEYELRSLDREPLPECTLELRPLIAFRDYHGTTHQNGALNPEARSRAWSGQYHSVPRSSARSSFRMTPRRWSRPVTGTTTSSMQVERERGLDFQEDLFKPFLLRFNLQSPYRRHRDLVHRPARSRERPRTAKARNRTPSRHTRRGAIVRAHRAQR